MRQDQAEEGDLLAPSPDLDRRLAEVHLGMARRVVQRNEGLPRRLPAAPDIILHDRVAAAEPVLVAQTLEDPMRRVPLLARHVRIRVRLQDRVDDVGEPVQLRPPHRSGPPIPRRRRIAQHLLYRPPVDAEPPTRLVMAQTFVDTVKRHPVLRDKATSRFTDSDATRGAVGRQRRAGVAQVELTADGARIFPLPCVPGDGIAVWPVQEGCAIVGQGFRASSRSRSR